MRCILVCDAEHGPRSGDGDEVGPLALAREQNAKSLPGSTDSSQCRRCFTAERCVFTYQTRLVLAPEQAQALNAYAELHGRAQRCLHAALRRHRSLNELKREFLPRFGLTARQFNGIRVELDGKVEAIRQRRPQLIEEAKVRLAKAHRLVNKLAQNSPGTNKLHQKKRRLAVLEQRLAALQRDEADGQVRLCFGSRRLFHAQYNLQANGLSDHEEWLDQWREALSRQFFVLGSQDETAGNQTCQAAVCEDGSLQLKLRLPDALMQECGASFLMIHGVRFAHGHGPIVSALGMSRLVSATTRAGKPASRRVGRAISYRFLRDDKGWRVFASVEVDAAAVTTSPALGCIGIDVNADHLAVAEVDRFGNLVDVRRIELPTRGKSSDQIKALIGDAAVQVAALAQARGKPLALEKLDFRKKKAELEAVDPTRSRLLSSFVFSRMTSALKAASLRAGVEVIEVNPAFTSIIGAVNHAQRRGISVHQGAACAVARRGLGLREAPAVREAIVPLRNGGHVTFAVPARNRAKHVWQQWSGIRTCLKAAHAAHWRSGSSTDPPAPLSPATQASSAHRLSTAQSRGANRSQHCSGSVMDDIPF